MKEKAQGLVLEAMVALPGGYPSFHPSFCFPACPTSSSCLCATGPFSTSWLLSHGSWLSTVQRSLALRGSHLDFQHRGKEVFGEGSTKPMRKLAGVQHFWGSKLTEVAAVEILHCSFCLCCFKEIGFCGSFFCK